MGSLSLCSTSHLIAEQLYPNLLAAGDEVSRLWCCHKGCRSAPQNPAPARRCACRPCKLACRASTKDPTPNRQSHVPHLVPRGYVWGVWSFRRRGKDQWPSPGIYGWVPSNLTSILPVASQNRDFWDLNFKVTKIPGMTQAGTSGPSRVQRHPFLRQT